MEEATPVGEKVAHDSGGWCVGDDCTEGCPPPEKVAHDPDLLHVVMDALANGGCMEDERGAAIDVLDALGLRAMGWLAEGEHYYRSKPTYYAARRVFVLDCEVPTAEPLLCLNCGKTMAEHGPMANCWGGGVS